MKRLGIDYGTKRVGLAVSDPDGTMAFPYATIQRTTRQDLFDQLLGLIEKEKIQEVVVGYPSPALSEGLIQRQISNFAESLRRRLSIPVHLMDETLSSAAAEEDLRSRGLKGNKLAQALDQQAAVRLLDSFLSQIPKE